MRSTMRTNTLYLDETPLAPSPPACALVTLRTFLKRCLPPILLVTVEKLACMPCNSMAADFYRPDRG